MSIGQKLLTRMAEKAWAAGRAGKPAPWFAVPGSVALDQYEDGASDRAYIPERKA